MNVPTTAPQLPSADPFYAIPTDLDSLAPGEIIRSRQVELKDFWASHHRSRAWQLAYRSTDLNGLPSIAVTTVVLPRKAATSAPRLLSFQCAIDAVTCRCFPSYALQKGAKSARAIAPFEFVVVRRALAKGWAVSIPDHEGMLGAWGAPREPGYRALDGIRAALSFSELGLDVATAVGLWGYSGGGMATAWAAEMAPTYAPELDIVGAVLGSPVGDMGSALLRLDGGFHSGLPIMAIAGLRRVYPALDRLIAEHATEQGRQELNEIEQMHTVDAVRRFGHQSIDDYLDRPLADILATPEMVEMMNDLQLGSHAPSVPLLVVQAVHDEIIGIDDIDRLVERYRDLGTSVTYMRDPISEHYTLLPLSGPVAVGWLTRRFDGRPPKGRTHTVLAGQRRPRLPQWRGRSEPPAA
ncbi:lipase family protein [Gordonia sp. NPDC003424]